MTRTQFRNASMLTTFTPGGKTTSLMESKLSQDPDWTDRAYQFLSKIQVRIRLDRSFQELIGHLVPVRITQAFSPLVAKNWQRWKCCGEILEKNPPLRISWDFPKKRRGSYFLDLFLSQSVLLGSPKH